MTYPPTPEDPSQAWQASPPPQQPYGQVPAQQPYGQMPPPPAGQPYPQQPYGYPVAPGYGAYPQAPTSNGMAVAALVCGIVGILVFGVILGPLAVIFGSIGLKRSKEGASGRGNSIAGIVLGIVGFVLAVALIVYASNHGGFVY